MTSKTCICDTGVSNRGTTYALKRPMCRACNGYDAPMCLMHGQRIRTESVVCKKEDGDAYGKHCVMCLSGNLHSMCNMANCTVNRFGELCKKHTSKCGRCQRQYCIAHVEKHNCVATKIPWVDEESCVQYDGQSGASLPLRTRRSGNNEAVPIRKPPSKWKKANLAKTASSSPKAPPAVVQQQRIVQLTAHGKQRQRSARQTIKDVMKTQEGRDAVAVAGVPATAPSEEQARPWHYVRAMTPRDIEAKWMEHKQLPGICWYAFHGTVCRNHVPGRCVGNHDPDDPSIILTRALTGFYNKRKDLYHGVNRRRQTQRAKNKTRSEPQFCDSDVGSNQKESFGGSN